MCQHHPDPTLVPASYPSGGDDWHLRILGVDRSIIVDGRVIRIAVVDGGVAVDHPELDGRCLPGRSFDPAVASPWPDLSDTHGTLAAILAAGQHSGIAPHALVLPVRFTGSQHSQWRETLTWAADHADVVLCPWVLPDDSPLACSLADALDASSQSAVFVAPTGNNPHRVGFPACHPAVLGVAAVTSESRPAEYSGRGCGTIVFAPSDGGRWRLPELTVRGRVCSFGGTSAASALAAGVVAQLISVCPLPPNEVIELLQQSTSLLASESDLGCLNLARALSLLESKPTLSRMER